jgi:hypothetical protein
MIGRDGTLLSVLSCRFSVLSCRFSVLNVRSQLSVDRYRRLGCGKFHNGTGYGWVGLL